MLKKIILSLIILQVLSLAILSEENKSLYVITGLPDSLRMPQVSNYPYENYYSCAIYKIDYENDTFSLEKVLENKTYFQSGKIYEKENYFIYGVRKHIDFYDTLTIKWIDLKTFEVKEQIFDKKMQDIYNLNFGLLNYNNDFYFVMRPFPDKYREYTHFVSNKLYAMNLKTKQETSFDTILWKNVIINSKNWFLDDQLITLKDKLAIKYNIKKNMNEDDKKHDWYVIDNYNDYIILKKMPFQSQNEETAPYLIINKETKKTKKLYIPFGYSGKIMSHFILNTKYTNHKGTKYFYLYNLKTGEKFEFTGISPGAVIPLVIDKDKLFYRDGAYIYSIKIGETGFYDKHKICYYPQLAYVRWAFMK